MEPLTRKERESQGRREDILCAAAEVFSQKGFAEATMEEIAERAEFGKGTIYNYFPSKLELFHTLIERGMEEMNQLFREVAALEIPPLEKARQMFYRQIQYIQQNVALFQVVSGEFLKLDVHRLHNKCVEEKDQITLKIFQDGVKKGDFKQRDPEILAVLYAGMIHSCIFHYWAHVKKLAPLTEAEITVMFDLFTTGILQ